MHPSIKQLLADKEEVKQRIKELKETEASIDRTINNLCSLRDTCPSCYGDGQIYDSSLYDPGDPNHRSSDCMVTCVACGGSGKYSKKG